MHLEGVVDLMTSVHTSFCLPEPFFSWATFMNIIGWTKKAYDSLSLTDGRLGGMLATGGEAHDVTELFTLLHIP